MGQKVNPHGLRVGVIKDWDSRWYAREDKVGDLIVEDYKIRQYLIDNNFIDTIIQLPDNLFFGTSIATCIMVLKNPRRSTPRCLSTPASSASRSPTATN